MITNYADKNYLVLIGEITSDKKFSHEIYGEKFYVFDLKVPRLSGNEDIIPITISERLITEFNLEIGKNVVVEGQFRSYNSYENDRNRLVLTVFAKDLIEYNKENNEENVSNEVVLNGYICKKPTYRQTPFGREIADILLAVNRAYNKSDYIPCIAWGRNARFCQNIEVGKEVVIKGRVQSRQYEKKLEDGNVEKRLAYEVSISSLELLNEKDKKIEEEKIENLEDTIENKAEENS